MRKQWEASHQPPPHPLSYKIIFTTLQIKVSIFFIHYLYSVYKWGLAYKWLEHILCSHLRGCVGYGKTGWFKNKDFLA